MGPVIRNVIRDCIRPVMGDEALVSRLLLDKFTGAAAAYSLETLSVDTDNVVRVREGTGNTERDFNATEVVNGTLTGFCGAGNGFVTTWYDQSGNGRDATQATAASQPQIVSAGSLVINSNGTPSVDFDGADDRLIGSHDITTNYTIFIVSEDSGNSTTYAADTGADFSNGVNFARTAGSSGSRVLTINHGSDGGANTSGTISGVELISQTYNGTTATAFIDGINRGSATIGYTASGTSLTVGGQAGGGAEYNGTQSALIVYSDDQSANRAAIEAKLAEIYGITLA